MSYLLIALAIALIAAAPLTYPGPLQTQSGVLYLLPSASLGAMPAVAGFSAALESLGLSRPDAFKIIEAASLVVGVCGIFALVRPRWGAASALVSAGLYTLLPYRLMLLYVQGNIGEAFFWGLLPWAFVASFWLVSRLTAAAPVRPLWLAVSLSAAVAAFLWRLCVPYAPDPSQAQAYPFQLFSARWGAGTGGDWLDAVPMQLGLAPLGLTVAALAVRRARATLALTALAGAFALLSVEPLSPHWPWQYFLNVPWQLVGAAGFCLSLAGGSLFAGEDARDQIPLLAAALTITVVASYPYLQTRGIDFTPARDELARFENGVWLLDASLSAPVQAGTALTITLVWQNTQPLAEDYHVFVHVLDGSDRLVAQRDRPPLDGARPTTTWQRGEVLRDPYPLAVPANAPPELRVAVGMYRYPSGNRVRLSNALDPTIPGPDRVIVAGSP